MEIIETDVCVGGPLDGEQKAVEGERLFFAVESHYPVPLVSVSRAALEAKYSTHTSFYDRSQFNGDGKTILYWKYRELGDADVVEKLFAAYVEHHALMADQPAKETA